MGIDLLDIKFHWLSVQKSKHLIIFTSRMTITNSPKKLAIRATHTCTNYEY